MIDELTKSIKATLHDRVSSPLSGAFAISWIVWNYKTVLTLFSGMSVIGEIDVIEKEIYSTFDILATVGFLYPLLSAFAIIVIYPFPAETAYRFSSFFRSRLKKIKASYEDETPLTVEESRKLRRDTRRLEDLYESQVQKLKDTLADRELSLTDTAKSLGAKEERLRLVTSELEQAITDRAESKETVTELSNEIDNLRNQILDLEEKKTGGSGMANMPFPSNSVSFISLDSNQVNRLFLTAGIDDSHLAEQYMLGENELDDREFLELMSSLIRAKLVTIDHSEDTEGRGAYVLTDEGLFEMGPRNRL